MRFIVSALALSLLVSMPIVASGRSSSTATASAIVSILFDLGDGTYYWSDGMVVTTPTSENASWDATLSAAATHHLAIEWTWYSCCGIAVTDVGNRHPPSGFVGLLTWNRTQHEWDFAATGISSLVLADGDTIAWYDAAFDGVTFEGRHPVPTPDSRSPATQFRGDLSNTGVSPSRAPNSVGVRWDHDTGAREIGSTPSVAYGKVFVNTRNGLVALDESTGQEVWTDPAARGMSSPAVFSDTLIVGGSDGRVHWVNASSGVERWNVTLLRTTQFSGITSSPKVAYDRVYVGTFNESGGAGEVVSMWVSNGTIVWRHATGSVHFSSPAIADGTVYVGVMGTYNRTTGVTFDPPFGVLALNAGDGSLRWFFPTSGSVAASPLINADRVIAPSKDGYVYALNVTTGAAIWRADVGAGISSPTLYGGVVFVGGGAFGGGGRITALRASDGAVLWTFQPNGPVESSVSYADGKILFSTNSENGTVYALDASTGDPIWEFEPMPAEYILGSPSVADGTVFAPSDNGHVYAIETASGSILDVTVEEPPSVSGGENVSVNITLLPILGAVRNVTMGVRFVGQDVVSATPAPYDRLGLSLSWKFGSIPFGEGRRVHVIVEGICGASTPPNPGPVLACGATGVVRSIGTFFTDAQGGSPTQVYYLYNVSFWATVGPTPSEGVFVPYVVAGVVATAIAVAVVAWRQKRRGP